MRHHLYLYFVILTVLAGCSFPVGGPCKFETRLGIAQIVELKGGKIFATFNPGEDLFTTRLVAFSPRMNFEVHQTVDEKNGTFYPARLDIMTQGSCTPYRFAVIATEHSSYGHFFPFSENGQVSPEIIQSINQVATIFAELTRHWPHLTLHLCGQTQREGSAEYNLELGNRYTHAITDLLEQAGVPATQINAISFGEQPCPHSTFFLNEVKNGVRLKFILSRSDLKTKE